MRIKDIHIKRAVEELNSRALDLFLYLAKLQNEFGQIRNVRYKDVMNALNMPKSSYYFALQELADKKFVTLSQNEWGCEHIVINDNIALSEENFGSRHFKLNRDFICSADFVALNINIKRFIFRMYDAGIFERKGVKLTADKLKKYKVLDCLEQLKEIFIIIEKDGVFQFSESSVLSESAENMKYTKIEKEILDHCRIQSIIPDAKALKNAVKLLIKHRFNPFLHKALDTIRQYGSIQPALMNMLLTKKAGYSI